MHHAKEKEILLKISKNCQFTHGPSGRHYMYTVQENNQIKYQLVVHVHISLRFLFYN